MAFCPKCGAQLGMMDTECQTCHGEFDSLAVSSSERPRFLMARPDRLTLKDIIRSIGHTEEFWIGFKNIKLDLRRYIFFFLVLLPIADALLSAIDKFDEITGALGFSKEMVFAEPLWSVYIASTAFSVPCEIAAAFLCVFAAHVVMILFGSREGVQLPWKYAGAMCVVNVGSSIIPALVVPLALSKRFWLPEDLLVTILFGAIMIGVICVGLLVVLPWVIGMMWYACRIGMQLSVLKTLLFWLVIVVAGFLLQLPVRWSFYQAIEAIPVYAQFKQRHSKEVNEFLAVKAAVRKMAIKALEGEAMSCKEVKPDMSFQEIHGELLKRDLRLYLGSLKEIEALGSGKYVLRMKGDSTANSQFGFGWSQSSPEECSFLGPLPEGFPDANKLSELSDHEAGMVAVISLKKGGHDKCESIFFHDGKFGSGAWIKAVERDLENKIAAPFEFRIKRKGWPALLEMFSQPSHF